MNIYYYDNNYNCSVSNLLNFRISLTMGVSIKTSNGCFSGFILSFNLKLIFRICTE